MSVVNPSTTSTDSWDYISSGQSPLPASQRKAQVVPDDWDADEDEEEEPQKLWDNANNKAPMPELVIASTSATSSSVPPPPAAFQPSLRILKRPSASPTPTSIQSGSADLQKSYAEREAQYQAARERIFGGDSTTPPQGAATTEKNRKIANRSSGSIMENATAVSSTVIRNPRGPDSASQDTPRTRGADTGSSEGRGFASRKGAARRSLAGRGSHTTTPPT